MSGPGAFCSALKLTAAPGCQPLARLDGSSATPAPAAPWPVPAPPTVASMAATAVSRSRHGRRRNRGGRIRKTLPLR